MQRKVPTVFMRGGTSRALIFKEEDLPADPEIRDQVILKAMGSPDPYKRQIDGVGGAISSTSKVVIIGRGSTPDVDVTYTFGQVSIDKPVVDRRGTCGNMAGAVGPFAIEEGLVKATDPVTQVRIFHTNTSKMIISHVPTRNGTYEDEGDFSIPGIPGTGSKVILDYMDPAGAFTGKLLPTGNPRDLVDVPGVGRVEVSLVDAANMMLFIKFEDVGLKGDEDPDQIEAHPDALNKIAEIRVRTGLLIGLGKTEEEMRTKFLVSPLPVLVNTPRDYRRTNGKLTEAGSIDLLAKAISMGRPHRNFPVTGAIGTTIAAAIEGTLPNLMTTDQTRQTGVLRLGHASGTVEMSATVRREGNQWFVEKASATRTARRIMEGHVLVPEKYFEK